MAHLKKCRCKSGLMGSQGYLRKIYVTMEDFEWHCATYNIHKRLGYKTPANAWRYNPLIQHSTEPSDLCKVKERFVPLTEEQIDDRMSPCPEDTDDMFWRQDEEFRIKVEHCKQWETRKQ